MARLPNPVLVARLNRAAVEVAVPITVPRLPALLTSLAGLEDRFAGDPVALERYAKFQLLGMAEKRIVFPPRGVSMDVLAFAFLIGFTCSEVQRLEAQFGNMEPSIPVAGPPPSAFRPVARSGATDGGASPGADFGPPAAPVRKRRSLTPGVGAVRGEGVVKRAKETRPPGANPASPRASPLELGQVGATAPSVVPEPPSLGRPAPPVADPDLVMFPSGGYQCLKLETHYEIFKQFALTETSRAMMAAEKRKGRPVDCYPESFNKFVIRLAQAGPEVIPAFAAFSQGVDWENRKEETWLLALGKSRPTWGTAYLRELKESGGTPQKAYKKARAEYLAKATECWIVELEKARKQAELTWKERGERMQSEPPIPWFMSPSRLAENRKSARKHPR